LNEDGQETKKILCATCKVLTNHQLHKRHPFSVMITDDADVVAEPDEFPSIAYVLSVWSCRGCGEPTLEWQVGAGDPRTDDFHPIATEYFPRRSKDSIQRKIFGGLKPDLARLYGELVTCFNEDCWQLCNLGLRALVEAVCCDQGCTGGDLKKQIDCLEKLVHSEKVREALHVFRESGNAATHPTAKKGEPAKLDELRTRIRMMEDLLTYLYDLDHRASQYRRANSDASNT